MRIASAFLLIFCLAGCNRGVQNQNQNKDAVRQSLVEYLKTKGLSVTNFDVDLSGVQFNGNRASGKVVFVPKGGNPAQGMPMDYDFEQQGGKWVVLGRKDVGASPHGGGAMPGGMPGGMSGGGMPGAMPGAEAPANPHGGAMPLPESLPPSGKKK